MNEYLITQLGHDHRNTLLAEAEADRVARLARAGRPTWWQRLTARVTTSAPDHGRQADRHAPRHSQHHLTA
jgi:hypothetical protein